MKLLEATGVDVYHQLLRRSESIFSEGREGQLSELIKERASFEWEVVRGERREGTKVVVVHRFDSGIKT